MSSELTRMRSHPHVKCVFTLGTLLVTCEHNNMGTLQDFEPRQPT